MLMKEVDCRNKIHVSSEHVADTPACTDLTLPDAKKRKAQRDLCCVIHENANDILNLFKPDLQIVLVLSG